MAKVTEIDGIQEQKLSKDVENNEVTVANVTGVEENGDPKKEDVHKKDVVVTENTKNVAEEVEEKVKEKENEPERGMFHLFLPQLRRILQSAKRATSSLI